MTSTAKTENVKPLSTSSTESTSSENGPTASSSMETLDLSAGALLVQKGRQNKRTKAIRLLVTGRLRVLRVDANFIAAECRGDSGEVYNLGWQDQRWTCSCLARTDCKHLNALWAVVAVSRR